MTPTDLDALEKLAESLSTLDSEERDWPLVKIHGRMFHVENAAKAASDGLTALIAELREAREVLIAVKVSADHMPPMSSTRRIEWRIKSFNPAISHVRAFLARNGKGDEPNTPRNAPRGLSDEC